MSDPLSVEPKHPHLNTAGSGSVEFEVSLDRAAVLGYEDDEAVAEAIEKALTIAIVGEGNYSVTTR